ncbi:thioesterase domain-containing protein [Xanthobacter sp. 126]|uniref:thioesterase domain-containing protein n=1 Tax=Xanthobacter sp. 126 TaxID=1131814 RepID=UPI00045EAE17|nr:thioesterase domain-containing protein [Xanthobacter sp. 126]
MRFVRALFAAVVVLCVAQPALAQQNRGHVYLLRGLANVFSLGMDDLAKKLNARGIPATVHEYGQWASLADAAAAESRATGNSPIIIVGHSLGADAAVEMAERLTALGTPPKLVVTFDPVGVTQVGASSGYFVNYYQSNNGYGKRLTAGPGFHGNIVNRNLNAIGGIDHFNIEKSPRLHDEVITQVRSITTPRPKPKPKPADPSVTPAAPATAPGTQAAAKPGAPG